MKCAVAVLTGLIMLVSGSAIRADEKKIPLSEVPKKVLDAVKARFPGAELKDAAKEVQDDETSYEIGMLNAGKRITVSVDDEGEIEEIETVLAVATFPRSSADAVTGKFPEGDHQQSRRARGN